MSTSREIVAANVRALIARSDLSVRGFALRFGLQQKAIDRLIKEENAASVDTLDEIATALGLFTWQLLVPGLDIGNPPHIAVGKSEIELYERLRSLVKNDDEREKGVLTGEFLSKASSNRTQK